MKVEFLCIQEIVRNLTSVSYNFPSYNQIEDTTHNERRHKGASWWMEALPVEGELGGNMVQVMDVLEE